MDEFSYLSVLLSIILGLAVTQILTGFRGLLQSRARVRIYWPAIAWAFLLLVICAQSWWAMFGLREHHAWTFGGFAVVLLHMICLYMLAALVLPDFPGDQPVDLHATYMANHRWFGAIAALSGFVSLSKDLVLSGALPARLNVAFHVVYVAGAVVFAISRSDLFHKVFVVVMSALFALYIAMLFIRLQ